MKIRVSIPQLVSVLALMCLASLVPGPSIGAWQDDAAAATTESETAPEAETEAPARADLTEANALVSAGSYPEAEGLLSGLQEEFPDDPRVLLMRGEVLLMMGQAEPALPLLERSLELDAERERIHFQVAAARLATGDAAGALPAFAAEIELNPDVRVKKMCRINRSMVLQNQRQFKEAAAELEAVLELEPESPEVYGDVVRLYLEAGDLELAAAALDRGLASGFRSAPHCYNVGARHFKQKAYPDAADAFRKALEIDPAFAPAERSLAAALDQLGRETEAVEHLRRYLELRPDDPDASEIAKRVSSAGS